MMTLHYAMRVAEQLQSNHSFKEAENILKHILAHYPSHAEALHLWGVIHYQKGQAATAIQLIQQAIDNNPTIALFHSNIGEIYRQLNNLDLSIQHGERAIALDPQSASAFSNLGIAYYDAKELTLAEKYHHIALSLNPSFPCSLNNLGSIYKIQGKMEQAILYYQAAISASPKFIEPLNNLGLLLIDLKRFTEAESYLKSALACNPRFAAAHYGIAKLYFSQHHFLESEEALHQAIAIDAQKPEYYELLSQLYYEQNKHAQAFFYLDKALSIDPTLSSLHIHKGTMLMETGDNAGAETQFLKMAEHPEVDTRVLVHYSLVQLRKIRPDHASLDALLSIAHNPQTISPDKLPYLYFALGKCHDDLGEFSKAFTYFAKGCALKRQQITFNIETQITLTEKIIRFFTQEKIDYLRAFAHSSATPIFIVGMPRSGTTLAEHILASHPSVYGAGELPYFHQGIEQLQKNTPFLSYPDNLSKISADVYHCFTQDYLAALARIAPEATHITDKMPHHFMHIGLIHALFPNAKIIHVKRNPIDTCLSCYTKLFQEGQLYSYDLTELGQYYRCYEKIMAHWRTVLPKHAWLDVNYEAFIDNVEIEAKRMITYCNLSWDPACITFYNSKRKIRTASFMQVRQPIYTASVDRWQNFKNELSPLIEALS